ncbi:aflatoxin regulatory protein-domain-containing protein [Aspergillus heterothallicus]
MDVQSLAPHPLMGPNIDGVFSPTMSIPEVETFELNPVPCDRIGGQVTGNDQLSLTMTELSDAESAGVVDPPAADPPCYMAIIMGILSNLFANMPTTCQQSVATPAYSQMEATQFVIPEKQDLLEAINIVLRCPCAENGYFITVLSLTMFEIMSVYAAASGERALTTEDKTAANVETRAIPQHSSISGDQKRITAQFILDELHRVQHLVNSLSSRLESVRLKAFLASAVISSDTPVAGQNSAPMNAQASLSPLSGSIFLQFEEDLRKRLHAVYCETLSTLRQS